MRPWPWAAIRCLTRVGQIELVAKGRGAEVEPGVR